MREYAHCLAERVNERSAEMRRIMKRKINNIINLKLYIDVLKQLRLIGFVCLGILAIIVVLMPIGEAIDLEQSIHKSYPIVTTTIQASRMMYLIFIVFTPILTIYIFSFLTKRNACDYFHSFPQKRGCLYNTYFAALATWIFIITAGTALFTGITYAILSKYFVFSYVNLIRYSISIFLCALLVAATIAIACSITGTIFTNIVVTGLILFLPRLITTIAISIVTSNLRMLVPTKILPLLDYNYNLIFNSLSGFFGSSDSNIYQFSSVIYTAVLSIIYIAVGRYLFVKRKSETAGNPAANKILQCIIRLGIAIPICMISVDNIFNIVIGEKAVNNSDIFSIIVFYIIAVIVMLLYELISTKRIKNVVSSIPSVGLLFLINVLIILLINGIYESQLNFNPSASDVKYIVVSDTNTDSELDYFEYGMSGKKIANQELINLLVENLSKNIEYEKTSYPGNYYRNNSTSALTSYATKSMQEIQKYVTVGFKTGLTVKYRKLYLDADAYKKYRELLLSSEDIKDFYLNLPEYNKNLMSISNTLTVKENEEIYNTLKDELKSMDYNLWYSLISENHNIINLYWTYNVNDKNVFTVLPLTSYTPKALLKYINYTNKTVEASKLLDDIKNIIDGKAGSYNIIIQNYNSDLTESLEGINLGKGKIVDDKELFQKFYNVINTNYLTTMDSIKKDGQTFVKIDVSLQSDTNSTNSYNSNYTIYTYIDNTSYEELENMQ